MSFDLANMERGAFCHDRCVCLLLAEYVQDLSAAKPNAEKAIAQAPNLSAGFGDCRRSGFHAPRGDITINAIRRKIGTLYTLQFKRSCCLLVFLTL
jgi:hypothetical protein